MSPINSLLELVQVDDNRGIANDAVKPLPIPQRAGVFIDHTLLAA